LRRFARNDPNRAVIARSAATKQSSYQNWEPAANPVFTIGHATRSVGELIALLRENAVDRLVDVRSVPRSRANPQFNTDALPEPLAAADIGYTHLKALGGLRHHPKGAPASPNVLWRNDAFRNYADYAMTPAFRAGLDELCDLAREQRCAVMCAEAVWWRCHRRIVADYLLARGFEVEHIMGPHRHDPARLTPGARPLPDGTLVYAAAEGHDDLPLFP
jgi:uncharacterized protein (DUF488 family)